MQPQAAALLGGAAVWCDTYDGATADPDDAVWPLFWLVLGYAVGTQITLTNEARMEIFRTLVLQDRDVGGKAALEAAGVQIGTPVIYRPQVIELDGDRIAGTSVDDRAGCAVLLEIARGLSLRMYALFCAGIALWLVYGLMLAQWLRLETPPHAVIATGLELLHGGEHVIAHEPADEPGPGLRHQLAHADPLRVGGADDGRRHHRAGHCRHRRRAA